jgi:hypothetical protein
MWLYRYNIFNELAKIHCFDEYHKVIEVEEKLHPNRIIHVYHNKIYVRYNITPNKDTLA